MSSGIALVHSILRYAVVITLLLAIARHFSGWFGKKEYTASDKKFSLFALIACHLQLVIGLILYFTSSSVKLAMADMGAGMKNAELRFWAVEHIAMMIIGIAIITVGYSTAKRMTDSLAKFKRIAIFYGIGFLLIMFSIPWPWSAISRGWI